jgi:8-amino-7-oxononanoate synthase
MPALESPIFTVPVGEMELMLRVGRELFEAGFKCGSVSFPAVPRQESLLRITANARHTDDDVDRLVEALRQIATAHGILGLSFAPAPTKEAA